MRIPSPLSSDDARPFQSIPVRKGQIPGLDIAIPDEGGSAHLPLVPDQYMALPA